MKVALTAGGTGGHILPALAVHSALRARHGDGLAVRWFGPDNRGERARVEAAGIPFEGVPSGAIRGKGALDTARGFLRLAKGVATATRRLRAFEPDVVLSTGGYGSFPASVAARILRRPLVVFLPDVTPGWAVRAERRLATRMATTTEAAMAKLPAEKTSVTGYPVRPEFFAQSREEARAALGIGGDERVILVTGASLGSRAINEAVFRGLRSYVEEATLVHITGPDDYDEAAGYEGEELGDLARRYRPARFRDDLPTVMLAADVAVMRAGASVLGEIPAAGLPAVLVPATFAGGHQRANAQWLADGGAAVILEEKDLRQLSERVLNLLNDHERLAAMRAAAKKLARPNAAADIAALLETVAQR